MRALANSIENNINPSAAATLKWRSFEGIDKIHNNTNHNNSIPHNTNTRNTDSGNSNNSEKIN